MLSYDVGLWWFADCYILCFCGLIVIWMCRQVSLASLRKDGSSHPLSSLVDECGRHYGFNEKLVKEIGSYFVLATVFPSYKVWKHIHISIPYGFLVYVRFEYNLSGIRRYVKYKNWRGWGCTYKCLDFSTITLTLVLVWKNLRW